jgi:sugar lactone lactonase YvrE
MTEAHVLASGLHFGEAPRWRDDVLWFSDFFDYAVKTVDMTGRVKVEHTFADRPSGLGWLPDGRLLVVSMTARSLLRQEGRQFVLHADLSPLATFHCNDMVVDSAGRAYVGNFGFDLDTAEINGTLAEVVAAHNGATLIRVDPDGSIHAAADGLMARASAAASPRSTSPMTDPCRTVGCGPTWAGACPTASASTPRERSGWPTQLPTSASASSKAAKSWR